jgi:parallel beta-helix repeat protein
LIGQNKNITIIDGQGNGEIVIITSPMVFITNFTIQNSTTDNYWIDAGIYVLSENNLIVNNNINDIIDTGIFIANSSYNNIKNNFIQRCGSGIDIWSQSKYGKIAVKNKIENNKITDTKYGIWVKESDKNNISNNYICRTLWDGIQLISARNNIICHNKINKSKYRSGIYLSRSYKNFLYYNNITKNRADGITLEGSSFNIIYKNNIEKNRNGLFIYLLSISNIISCNNFIKNKIRNAFFRNSFINHWRNNYWDDWIGLKLKIFERFPKLISGRFRLLRPRINFDFYPAKIPYEI